MAARDPFSSPHGWEVAATGLQSAGRADHSLESKRLHEHGMEQVPWKQTGRSDGEKQAPLTWGVGGDASEGSRLDQALRSEKKPDGRTAGGRVIQTLQTAHAGAPVQGGSASHLLRW